MNCRGGPNSLSKNHISFRCKKTNPKTSLLYLLCLDHENLFLSIMLMQEVACFQSLQSRRFEARRGLGEAWARSRLGRKTYWHKDKARLIGTRNYWGGPFLRACFFLLFFSVQRQMALARSFIKPERQLHFANSPN